MKDFSPYFKTNVMFSYYIGIVINSFTIFIIFLAWPKKFYVYETVILNDEKNFLNHYFPGIMNI